MRLVKESVIVLILRITGLLIQLAVFALIARTHSLYEVGVFAFVNAIWVITRTIGPLGYDQAAMRFIPDYLRRQKPSWILEFIQSTRQRIKQCIIVFCMGFGISGVSILFLGGEYSTYGIPVILLSLGIPAYALIGLDVCVVRSLGKATLAQIPESLFLQILLIFGIWLTVLTDITSIEITLTIQVGVTWLVLAFYRLIIPLKSYQNYKDDGSILNLDSVHAMAASTMKAMIATALAARLPVVVLSVVATSEMLGLFEGALRIGLLGSIPVWAVGVVVSPMIARAAASSDLETIRQLYAVAGVLQMIPALVVLIILMAFGDTILLVLFGESFQVATDAAVIVALAITVNGAGSIASSYLLMTNGEKIVQTYSIWSLVVVVLGVPIGVLLGDLEGAAWALVLRSLVRDIGLTVVVAKTRDLIPGLLSATLMKWMINNIVSQFLYNTTKRR